MKVEKLVMRSVICFILVVVLLIVGLSSIYEVRENQYALKYEFGKIVEVNKVAGLSFKIPFINTIRYVDKCMNLYDINKSDVITKDKKTMICDSYVLWKVVDPTLFAQTLSASNANAENRIDVVAYNSIKNTISTMTQDEIIALRGEEINILLTQNTNLTEYGIEIEKVAIKLFDLPDANKEAVYQRMISERNNIAASYTANGEAEAQLIRNETDRAVEVAISEAEKQAEILRAEGEAEYMRILAEAYNTNDKEEFYTYLRSLDALEQSMKGEKTIVLDKSSPIAQLLDRKSVV